MLLMLFASTAAAGKLATGLFGVPWGAPPVDPPLMAGAAQAAEGL